VISIALGWQFLSSNPQQQVLESRSSSDTPQAVGSAE
jgi:hypothetical protein